MPIRTPATRYRQIEAYLKLTLRIPENVMTEG